MPGTTLPKSRTTLVDTGWRVTVLITILAAAAAVARFGLPHHPDSDLLAAAVTADFALVVPGVTYCLLVRSRRWPLVVVVAAFLTGCAVASLTIPIDRQRVLDIVKFGLIPAEAAVLLFLLTATRRALRTERYDDARDFPTRLRRTARAVTGSRLAAGVLATEISVLRYSLTRAHPATTGYTVHRRSGYGSIVAGVLMAMVPETAAVHVLLSRWSPTAAWIVTALGIYAALWLLGDYRALAARSIELTPKALCFRYGLRWQARIPRRRIAGAELVSQKPKATPAILCASVWGPPNLRLLLHKPTVLHGLYGMRRKVTEIHVRVDEPAALRAALLAPGV